MVIHTAELLAWWSLECEISNSPGDNQARDILWAKHLCEEAGSMQLFFFGGQGDKSRVKEVSQMDVSHAVLINSRVRELLLAHLIYF